MKRALVSLFCLLFALVSSILQSDRVNSALDFSGADIPCYVQEDSSNQINDENAFDLLSTYDRQSGDFVHYRINSWRQQLRTLNFRIQIRVQRIVQLLKQSIRLLSDCLTTFVLYISQIYTTVKPLCWQRASDCYVFALRQLII